MPDLLELKTKAELVRVVREVFAQNARLRSELSVAQGYVQRVQLLAEKHFQRITEQVN